MANGTMEVLAGANVRHTSVVFLSLPLRFVHWLIGSARDCIVMLTMPIIPELLESGASCFGGGGGGGWA
jgi:hypothetical protein